MARQICWRAFAVLFPGCAMSLLMRLRRRQVEACPGEPRHMDHRDRQTVGYCQGFVLLPRRWVVERTLAWLNRNRRLAKDFEATVESAVTWLYIASVKLMSRRLARADPHEETIS